VRCSVSIARLLNCEPASLGFKCADHLFTPPNDEYAETLNSDCDPMSDQNAACRSLEGREACQSVQNARSKLAPDGRSVDSQPSLLSALQARSDMHLSSREQTTATHTHKHTFSTSSPITPTHICFSLVDVGTGLDEQLLNLDMAILRSHEDRSRSGLPSHETTSVSPSLRL